MIFECELFGVNLPRVSLGPDKRESQFGVILDEIFREDVATISV
jgi:hypothetical protein